MLLKAHAIQLDVARISVAKGSGKKSHPRKVVVNLDCHCLSKFAGRACTGDFYMPSGMPSGLADFPLASVMDA